MSVSQQISDLQRRAGLVKSLRALRGALEKAAAAQQPPVLTQDKKVPPEYSYAFRDGDEATARFYYQDPVGNLVRFTNAPTDSDDHSPYFGEAEPHPAEPTLDRNPEYFSPEGRKLTRRPDIDPAGVEWNQSYSRYDPQNLWVGRWRDPDTGELQHTYLDADVREQPRLQLHQQNALVDARIPALRQYIGALYRSDRIKDQITAVALALMDQGRMRAVEVACLRPRDVQFRQGPIVELGRRRIHAGPEIEQALETLKRTRSGDEPLFSVPLQDAEGGVDQSLRRRLGPNYLMQVLDTRGIGLYGLQTYHGTLAFVREAQRRLTQYDLPWEQAKMGALMVAALEWGHDFQAEDDPARVLQLIEAVLIDPIAAETLYRNAEAQGLVGASGARESPPAMIPIHRVTMDLADRTQAEAEFSRWLHAHPIHEHAEPPSEAS